jgi:hypothetical protein
MPIDLVDLDADDTCHPISSASEYVTEPAIAISAISCRVGREGAAAAGISPSRFHR